VRPMCLGRIALLLPKEVEYASFQFFTNYLILYPVLFPNFCGHCLFLKQSLPDVIEWEICHEWSLAHAADCSRSLGSSCLPDGVKPMGALSSHPKSFFSSHQDRARFSGTDRRRDRCSVPRAYDARRFSVSPR